MYEYDNAGWVGLAVAWMHDAETRHLSKNEQEKLKIKRFESLHQYHEHADDTVYVEEKKASRSSPKKALQSVFQH